MPFQDLTHAVMEQFPRVRIRYKDQSLFMQIWAFFDKTFLSESFTFQSTIYFPSQHFTKLHPVTSAVLLLHELVRLHASKRKACLSSLYVTWKLSQRLHFHPHLQAEAQEFVRLLKRHGYLPFICKKSSSKLYSKSKPERDPARIPFSTC
jgi:hypothetical protein